MSDERPDSGEAKPAPQADTPPEKPNEPDAAPDEEEVETPHPLIAALEARFPGKTEAEGTDQAGTPIVRVGGDDLVEVLTWLRDEETTAFDYLSCVTAIDWTEREPRFDVVYNLLSLPRNHRLTVKTGCADGDGVPSVVDIWGTADWLERETYDLYGIEFLGHPNLERMFLPDDWEGFPLRKDYPLEGPNLELLTRQQAAFRGGRFDRIRGDYEMSEQERQMAAAGVVGPLWTPAPDTKDTPDDNTD
jgi:NADH-quinone oxidoreductase subunit C